MSGTSHLPCWRWHHRVVVELLADRRSLDEAIDGRRPAISYPIHADSVTVDRGFGDYSDCLDEHGLEVVVHLLGNDHIADLHQRQVRRLLLIARVGLQLMPAEDPLARENQSSSISRAPCPFQPPWMVPTMKYLIMSVAPHCPWGSVPEHSNAIGNLADRLRFDHARSGGTPLSNTATEASPPTLPPPTGF